MIKILKTRNDELLLIHNKVALKLLMALLFSVGFSVLFVDDLRDYFGIPIAFILIATSVISYLLITDIKLNISLLNKSISVTRSSWHKTRAQEFKLQEIIFVSIYPKKYSRQETHWTIELSLHSKKDTYHITSLQSRRKHKYDYIAEEINKFLGLVNSFESKEAFLHYIESKR